MSGRPWNKGLVGRQGSSNWRGTNISMEAAHDRATKVLPRECALADETCVGRLEVAFRHDAPPELVRIEKRGFPYFVGEDSTEGYRRLCRSHHRRYDRPERRGDATSPSRRANGRGLTGAAVPLSPQQHEVLTLAARGMDNREIAAELDIGNATVRQVMHVAYPRLGVANRAEAVLAYMQQMEPAPEIAAVCSLCGMTGPTNGPDNLFVHLLEAHPFSWQAEAISEAVLHT